MRLGIYDLAGRLVRTSVDGDLAPGDYRGHIDLAGLAAGMYYCALKAPQGTRRSAFVVMR